MPSVAQFFQTWGAMIQTIALVITLIVLIFYTIFTYQLRSATVRQTELQLTPYIVLDYKDDLVCRNVGNSTAINVEVSSFEAINTKSNNLVFKVSFPPLYILEPQEDKILQPEFQFEDKELEYIAEALEFAGTKFFPFFPKEAKKDEYPLTIEYENTENMRYKTLVIVKCREEKIKVINIEPAGKRKIKKEFENSVITEED